MKEIDVIMPEKPKSELGIAKDRYKSNIWKLYLYHFLLGCHFITGILLPFFLQWGGLNFVEVMLLQSYFTIMILIFEIPCGAVSDYISRKSSLVFGALVTAMAPLVYSNAPCMTNFLLGETLWALGGAFISGTDQAIIYDTLKKMDKNDDIGKIMARKNSFFLAGVLIAAPLGSIMALYIPLNAVMMLMFVPFSSAVVISFMLKEPNHNLAKESKSYKEIIKSGFKELKANRVLRILTTDSLIVDCLVFFLLWTYQLYLGELGIPLVYYGFIAAAMTSMQIIFSNIAPKMEEKFSNKKRFLQIYTIIPGIGFILIVVIYIPLVGIVLLLTIIGFGMTRQLIFIKAINTQIETENRATVLSTVSMIINLLKSILYPIIGILVLFSLNLTFIILGTSLVILTLITRVKNEYLP